MTTTLDRDQVRPLSLTNDEIAVAAGIEYSKLDLAGSIVAGDIVSLTWGQITGEPTTLAGYGITDAQPLDATLSALAGLADAAGVLTNNGSGVLSWGAGGGGGGIGGAGTAGKIAKWSAAAALTDSLLTEAGAVVTLTGDFEVKSNGQGILFSSRDAASSGGGRNIWIGGGGAAVTGGVTNAGSWNVALGYQAMLSITTGAHNTAVGYGALRAATTSLYAVAVGYEAAANSTVATANIAIGFRALYANVGGSGNVAVGYAALAAVNANSNTGIGSNALTATVGGIRNAALGSDALAANVSGDLNVAMGFGAATAATGSESTAVGSEAAFQMTSGGLNTAIGRRALGTLTTGQGNTAIGKHSGDGITTGSWNTILGAHVMGLPTNLSNTVIIADGQGNQRIYVTSSGEVGIAGTDVLLVRDAANTLALRNGANAQRFNIYNTYTDASNFERAFYTFSGGNLTIGTEGLGTGIQRPLVMQGASINFRVGTSVNQWNMNTSAFLPLADNAYDIGGVSNRVRNLYIAGTITAPGMIGVGAATPGNLVYVYKNANSVADVFINQATSGNAAYARLILGTTTANAWFDLYSNGIATSGGAVTGDAAAFATNAPNGFSLQSNYVAIRFYVGGGTATDLRVSINTGGAMRLHAYGAGTLTTDASGNITAVSDERLKDRIEPYRPGLREVLALRPIAFHYTRASGLDTAQRYAGFSAQQTAPHLPEAVGVGFTFSDRPVLAAVVNAIRELHAQIDSLKGTTHAQ